MPETIYTCPMHPQIRQAGPGGCPICGMTLEPVVATAQALPNTELADMTRRFWIACVLAAPVVVLEMGGPMLHLPLGMAASNAIQFVLATPVVLWAGAPFFARGWQSLVHRSLNMFTLIALGMGAAWSYSVVALLAPQIFPPAFRRRRHRRGLFRGRFRDHRAGAAGPDAGTARPRTYVRRHPGAAEPGAKDRAAADAGRRRTGHAG